MNKMGGAPQALTQKPKSFVRMTSRLVQTYDQIVDKPQMISTETQSDEIRKETADASTQDSKPKYNETGSQI